MPKQYATYYHGTSHKEWLSIQLEGLIPGKGLGGDYWSEHSKGNLVRDRIGTPPVRTPGVYVTTNPHHAEWFARMASEDNHSKPVVLAVTLPDASKLVIDEEDIDAAYRYEGLIPASNITFHHAVLGAQKATNGIIFDLLGLY